MLCGTSDNCGNQHNSHAVRGGSPTTAHTTYFSDKRFANMGSRLVIASASGSPNRQPSRHGSQHATRACHKHLCHNRHSVSPAYM